VAVQRNRGVIAVVGAGIADAAETLARALGALRGLRVHLATLGASRINLTLVVEGEQVAAGMRLLHEEFFGAGGA
jgi:aspartate kinase